MVDCGQTPVHPVPGRLLPRTRLRRASLVAALIAALLSSVPGAAVAATGPAATQKRLNAVASRISRLQSVLSSTQLRVASAQKQIKESEKKLRNARAGIQALTRGLYMGGLGDTSSLLSAESVTEFGDRVSFVEHLRAGDRDVLLRVAIARRNLQRRQLALQSVLRRQESLMRSLSKERAALSRLFREQQSALRAQRSRRRASRDDPILVSGRGPFEICPVDRPRAYSNDFGAPRGDHRHQGNDILAPRGTPIRAPFDGRVTTNTSGSGGRQARVFGAAGYVFNAHLNSWSGARGFVRAGTIIGYVGDSGNARGGPTHNHFEWHPGGGRAVNPYRFLNLVC